LIWLFIAIIAPLPFDCGSTQIRIAFVTAESGGLGQGSERLHLSQPAASRQHALEQELGVPLFQLIGRRLQLNH
jgi:DNA-binding transcriptional LysR family regulator